MMTNEYIMRTAMEQSAIDSNCPPGYFSDGLNHITVSRSDSAMRKYISAPFFMDMTYYGSGVVASVDAGLRIDIGIFLELYGSKPEHIFETPALYELNKMLDRHGGRVKFMAEYFLPDADRLRLIPCGIETRLLTADDFGALYLPEWSNALCEKRRELDVLGVGAYDGGKLIALAACSADCDSMWQIGIDVLPEYRGRGLSSALTSRLALEIIERGKVPFYCAAWSNIKSVRNAIASGFKPAWAQMTAVRIAS